MRNPYEVLGINSQATSDQIKTAYRRLAKEFHPDVHPDKSIAETRFKEITSAYDILSDENKRSRYDKFGTLDENVGHDPFGGMGGIGDIFDMFFGSSDQRNTSSGKNGDNLRYDLTVELETILKDTEYEITYSREIHCSSCHGIGTENGTPPEKCTTCQGKGIVTQVQNSFLGQMKVQMPCPKCKGQGSFIHQKCSNCKGYKLIADKRKLNVKIPAGIEDGVTLHYPSQGSEGTGNGRPGDLYVIVHIKNDPRFEREGADVYTQIDVSFTIAVLGGTVQVDGLEGPMQLKILPGTASQAILKLSQLGLPILHRRVRGDMLVQVNIKVPLNITDSQRNLLLEFSKLSGEDLDCIEDKEVSILGSLFKKKKQ